MEGKLVPQRLRFQVTRRRLPGTRGQQSHPEVIDRGPRRRAAAGAGAFHSQGLPALPPGSEA